MSRVNPFQKYFRYNYYFVIFLYIFVVNMHQRTNNKYKIVKEI